MTMTDDQRLADQLRAVFDEHSAGVAPLVDRRAAVARRITRHKRVRTLSAMAALLVVVGSIAGVLGVRDHRAGPVLPAVTPSPTVSPGQLPKYQNGGILMASATIDASRQSSGSLTFTPESWDMIVGDSCAVIDSNMWLVAKVNGHSFSGSGCSPNGGGGTAGGSFGQHEQFWRNLGVELGAPSTITFQIGIQKTGQKDLTVKPRLSSGLVSVGVYSPVPFDQYPLDPKPSDWSPTDSTHFEVDPGMHQVGQVGELGKSDVEQGDLTVALPKHLTILVRVNAPGIVTVFIDGTPVFDCGSYGWGMGCESGPVAVGTEQLAGLKTGQLATFSVQTEHFTEPNAVEVVVYGD